MNKQRITYITAVIVIALGWAAPASASGRRVPASICIADTDYPGDYVFERGIANQSSGPFARARWVHCPVLDDNLFISGIGTPGQKTATNGLWVDGWDGNNESGWSGIIYVRVCQYAPWGSAVACTNWAAATDGTFTGGYSHFFGIGTPPTDELRNLDRSWWYPDLQVQLPWRGILGNSSVYGYFIF